MGLLFKKRGDRIEEFNKFLKDVLGFDTVADVKTALGIDVLRPLLTNYKTAFKVIQDDNVKLKNDIGVLNAQMADMVDRADLIAADNQRKKAIADLGNL